MLLREQIDEIVGSFSERITLKKNGQIVFKGTISYLVDNREDLMSQELLEELSFCSGHGYIGVLI